MSFPRNKILFICNLKHKHDQCECDSVAERISLDKQKFHIPFTATEIYPRVNDENLYPKYEGEKIIFTSNQYLCLNLNELKFKPTTNYMSVN